MSQYPAAFSVHLQNGKKLVELEGSARIEQLFRFL